jgi:predicted transcriptional regulator of viral defense system/predicted nucleotidyltransferase
MEKQRSTYTNSPLSGLGKLSRFQLAAVLRQSTGTLSPAMAAKVLSLSRIDAAKLLSRWAAQGWLQRVRRGIYVPVPLESERADSAPEDSWIIAEAAFAPCYICGWSAAEHWGLTEQVFRVVLVSTTRRPRDREPKMGGIGFRLRTVNEKAFFGLKTVWRGRARVKVSDPSRTIIDLMSDPSLSGGLRSSVDMLQIYLASKEHRDIKLLMSYAKTLGVGAVFKRLGFLLARYAPEEQEAIKQCARSLTQGYTQLDPAQPARKFVTAWRLSLPEGWEVRPGVDYGTTWARAQPAETRPTLHSPVAAYASKGPKSVAEKLRISPTKIAMLCRKYGIAKLSLFGSASRNELTPESDVDLMVEFAPDSHTSLFDITQMQDEFPAAFGGRKVDIVTPEILLNPVRRNSIAPDLKVIYPN